MKNFTKRDESFVCENCGMEVEKLVYSSRDHCPYCLCSKHVDKLPGDRAESCKGILKPVQTIPKKDGFDIIYKCDKCNEIRKNKSAADDDIDLLIKLTVNKNF
jgi:hypothetical protein